MSIQDCPASGPVLGHYGFDKNKGGRTLPCDLGNHVPVAATASRKQRKPIQTNCWAITVQFDCGSQHLGFVTSLR